MDFELTEEQRAFQDTARTFARQEMMPFAREWDENEIFPVEALRKAAALGFGGIYVRDDVGGSDLANLDAILIFEELAQGCTSTDRLYLDPQHGGLDDRPLWLGRAAAAPVAPSCAPWSISRATASPSRTPARTRPASPPVRASTASTTCSTAPRRSFPAPARRTFTSAWCAPGEPDPRGFPASWSKRARPACRSAPRRRSSAGSRSRTPW